MRFSSGNTLYLYTSLLGSSTCSSGALRSFSFCYRPTCGNESSTGGPEFYVLLLVSTGGETGYSVIYIHEESQEVIRCEESNTDAMLARCKEISVNSSMSISVNTSFSLAFIVPENASGRYLYEADSESLGAIFSPSPPIPGVGDILGQPVQETSGTIPNRLFQVVIEPEVHGRVIS